MAFVGWLVLCILLYGVALAGAKYNWAQGYVAGMSFLTFALLFFVGLLYFVGQRAYSHNAPSFSTLERSRAR